MNAILKYLFKIGSEITSISPQSKASALGCPLELGIEVSFILPSILFAFKLESKLVINILKKRIIITIIGLIFIVHSPTILSYFIIYW